MTKLKWDRKPVTSVLDSDYYRNPKQGFDQKWHNQRAKLREHLGAHKDHQWEIVNKPSGPHAGKVICNSCGGKFVTWLPKGYITSNT